MRQTMRRIAIVTALAAPFGAAEALGDEFLQRFEGRFVGGGTLARSGGSHSLNCNLNGRPSGPRLALAGTCRANVFASANISIDMRWDEGRKRYVGQFRDGLGTVSSIVGQRRGESLQFMATETAESVRPDPPAHMTLTRDADGLDLTVRNTQAGKGSAIALDLKKQ